MPKKTAKAAAINTKGAVALVKAIMSPIGSDTDSDIKPIVPTDKSKWQELNCIVPALVKQLVLYEAQHHGLSVNQVVQNPCTPSMTCRRRLEQTQNRQPDHAPGHTLWLFTFRPL